MSAIWRTDLQENPHFPNCWKVRCFWASPSCLTSPDCSLGLSSGVHSTLGCIWITQEGLVRNEGFQALSLDIMIHEGIWTSTIIKKLQQASLSTKYFQYCSRCIPWSLPSKQQNYSWPFIDEAKEYYKAQVTCPGSHNQWGVSYRIQTQAAGPKVKQHPSLSLTQPIFSSSRPDMWVVEEHHLRTLACISLLLQFLYLLAYVY